MCIMFKLNVLISSFWNMVYFDTGKVNNSMKAVKFLFVCILRQDVDFVFVQLRQTKKFTPSKSLIKRDRPKEKKNQEFLKEWEISALQYFFVCDLGFGYSDHNPHIT